MTYENGRLLHIIGVDPGGTTGIADLLYWPSTGVLDTTALQAPPGAVEELLHGLAHGINPVNPPVLAVETFIVGSRAGRSKTPGGGKAAREVIGTVSVLAEHWKTRVHQHPAGVVKPKMTDKVLKQYLPKLWSETTGMGHARDAARHALYVGMKYYRLPDPASGRIIG